MSMHSDGAQDFASLPPLLNILSGGGGGGGGGGVYGVGGSEHDQNSTDVLDGSGSNPNISRGYVRKKKKKKQSNQINFFIFCRFRFSDPCLLNPSDNDSKLSGQNTPECRNGNNSNSASAASALNVNGNGSGVGVAGDVEQQNKFFAALMEQINILHETNSKICRNLHETKGRNGGGMKKYPGRRKYMYTL